MTVFNRENKNFLEKKYPLFFGEESGLFDTVNVTYPELEELYQQQISQIWNEFEVDVTQDRMDMQNLPRETTDLIVKTLSWQHLADSVAGRSITGLLIPHCTNSELEGMLTAQAFFEVIHSRTYSHIIKQTFADPNQMLEDTYKNVNVLIRSENIVKAFDDLEGLSKDAPLEEKQDAMIRAFAALFALEGIAFMASFAVTFAVAETDVFQGIGALVAMVARDETLHTRMDYTILDILFRDSAWTDAVDRNRDAIREILDAVVQQEMDWAGYLFSEGRQIVGLSAELLKEYVQHMAKPIYDALGMGGDYNFQVVEENPLPFMEKYIDPSQMQSAAQEINITAYKIGSIADDSDSLDLDDFDF